MGSKLGADSNLLASPVKTKLGCCMLGLVPAALEAELIDDLKSIQGTATCLLPAPEVEEVIPVPEVAPGVEVDDAAPAPLLNERTANSSRPDAGLTMVSAIVPI